MAKTSEALPTLPSQTERESGEYPTSKKPDRVEHPEISFEELQGNALEEVEKAAREAEEYAESEGVSGIAESIRAEKKNAEQEIQRATEEAKTKIEKPELVREEQRQQLVERVDVENEKAKELKKALKEYGEDAERMLHLLEDEKRRTGKEDVREMSRLKSMKALSKQLRQSPEALLAMAAVAAMAGADRLKMEDAIIEQVDLKDVDPIAVKSIAERMYPAPQAAEEAPPVVSRAEPYEAPKKKGIGAIGIGVGAAGAAGAAGVFGIGSIFNAFAKTTEWFDRGLKYMFETDLVTKLKNYALFPEKVLDWMLKHTDEKEKK
ncbi:MAG: hypothetical protein WC787_01330 [Patescibacteria group bacterium]|jgi:hypothetical protein